MTQRHTTNEEHDEAHCKAGYGSSQRQGQPDLPKVIATPHAWQRGWERHSPAPLALAAVRRNLVHVQDACKQKGDRAAVDYQRGFAVVERGKKDRFAIITIRSTYMGPGRLPLIVDGDASGNAVTSGPRRATTSIGAILQSRGVSMTAVVGV